MNTDLLAWLERNKITYNVLEEDVIEIVGFGKMYVEDTTHLKSIFRVSSEGEVIFNTMENIQVLQEEEIFYIAFPFGDNWYYWNIREKFQMNVLKYIGQRQECSDTHPFVNLGIHTPYELLNGSFGIADWIRKAKHLGHNAIGICDKNTMAACYNLQMECQAEEIKHIFGYSLTFKDGEAEVGAKVYVQSQTGLQNLLRIQKAINVDSEDKTISVQELMKLGEGNVLVFDKYSSQWIINNIDVINQFLDCFDDCMWQLDLTEYKAERIDIKVLESAKLYFDKIYDTGLLPPVLIADCYYLDKEDAKNKILLNKIDSGAAHEQSDEQYFKDIDEHKAVILPLFDHNKWDIEDIFSWACENTVIIAENATAKIHTDRNFMPEYDLTEEEKEKYGDRHTMFLELLEEGFNRLVPEGQEQIYRDRLDHEIYVLESTNNVDYMLVQYDTVNWARRNGILIGCGRGSAGGCLVLYLLGVTLIDPIKYNLLFERFLLPERAGLYEADVTIVGEDITTKQYVSLTLDNNQTYKIASDAELMVLREGTEGPIKIYADELQPNDDIQFDNKDFLFTLNEI